MTLSLPHELGVQFSTLTVLSICLYLYVQYCFINMFYVYIFKQKNCYLSVGIVSYLSLQSRYLKSGKTRKFQKYLLKYLVLLNMPIFYLDSLSSSSLSMNILYILQILSCLACFISPINSFVPKVEYYLCLASHRVHCLRHMVSSETNV